MKIFLKDGYSFEVDLKDANVIISNLSLAVFEDSDPYCLTKPTLKFPVDWVERIELCKK